MSELDRLTPLLVLTMISKRQLCIPIWPLINNSFDTEFPLKWWRSKQSSLTQNEGWSGSTVAKESLSSLNCDAE